MSRIKSLYTLQAMALYALIVAGKSAEFAQKATERFLMNLIREPGQNPFAAIRQLAAKGLVEVHLRGAKTGNYRRLTRAFTELAESRVNLRTCETEALEHIHGIGPKTSRFFVMWTRPDYRCAVLDVHILRWLRARGHEAPRATPQSRKLYARLEKIFLEEADRRGKTPRELDSEIWDAGARHSAEGGRR